MGRETCESKMKRHSERASELGLAIMYEITSTGTTSMYEATSSRNASDAHIKERTKPSISYKLEVGWW